jgi:hypothetical protein
LAVQLPISLAKALIYKKRIVSKMNFIGLPYICEQINANILQKVTTMVFYSDHKLRQKLYLSFGAAETFSKELVFLDALSIQNELILHIQNYFLIPQQKLIIPAKSFAVALIYAYELKKYFDRDIRGSLDDPDFFAGTDQFFQTYSQAPKIYEEMIAWLEQQAIAPDFNISLDQVQVTLNCFKQEFYLSCSTIKDVFKHNGIPLPQAPLQNQERLDALD